MNFLRIKTLEYSALNDASTSDLDDEDCKASDGHQSVSVIGIRYAWIYVLALVGLIMGSMLFGYSLGRKGFKDDTLYKIDDWQFHTTTQSFEYNRTFAEAPSNETDAAWMSIFPPHGGFFHDKNVAKDGASLSVYHQLHCLDAIRHAYWILHDALTRDEHVLFDELPDWYTPWHTRHCIDFLRQMLMCNADVTIERNQVDIGGIRGFQIQHQCKRWEDVIGWTLDRQQAGVAQGYVYPSDLNF